MINLVWAMTEEGVIGTDNSLPWNIKAEMQYFRSITINTTVIMGAKTFESIGFPLKKRYNIIATHHRERYQQWHNIDNIAFSDNLLEYLQPYKGNKTKDICVLGGKTIYEQAWKLADYLYISIIKHPYSGNIIFPNLDFSDFKLIKTTNYDQFTAKIYQRKELI
ncbi:dihydrofolate reductase [Spiroplasma endosymbiont of Nebria brevicollis]|uniref:dihydrofolate reductase n=1 Tax=Spiroplasma endosymbiont of Nebria brevicollis TaxID=3066284 RepID=UPI00313AF5E9